MRKEKRKYWSHMKTERKRERERERLIMYPP